MRTTRLLATAAALLVVACDFHVTNPGPVQDDFLDLSAAYPAIVNGAGRNLSDALNWISYTGAAVARELNPAGSTGSFGISVQQQNGKLMDDEVNTHWGNAQQARWTAEQGLERLRAGLKTDFAKSKDAAQLLLWAAYSNRLLGENMCDAVIDGGPKEAYTVYLDRAEAQFTEAIAVATAASQPAMATAATAGRASVRALKGNWSGAVADAAGVPNAFVYQMPYNTVDVDQYNRIYWAGANQPYRAHTVWHTFYEEYFKATKDPRVAWDSDPKNPTGDAAVGNLGRVPWYFQTKFKVREAPINLSSGWEMRLIEAEAKLVANDVAGAATLINAHRVALGLAPWPAATAVDAWTALKRERGIELWLEARRLADLRRWAAANRPGVTDDMAGRDLCFPISRNEKETNPNLAS
ncbi:RagB/SusD domain-containing protein [Gemmatirosa kalamazoonensis]|uniref:RagB/SusD domain-containing protein n=1 Tax=Gemmatirosa kalamazoonensis TaxID=861299 RepID=W0RN74_9BACT|nr:RagB/SusD family nutrient uptake outer membrane protein [Gemmatirosa kalamazoonensis]AHG91765.1 RagB/SusD domain-containing protein [Gemmatirosa kalamazoonensis]